MTLCHSPLKFKAQRLWTLHNVLFQIPQKCLKPVVIVLAYGYLGFEEQQSLARIPIHYLRLYPEA